MPSPRASPRLTSQLYSAAGTSSMKMRLVPPVIAVLLVFKLLD